MKFDTTKTGLETILLPHQVAALRFIWEYREGTPRTVHKHTVKVLELKDRRSRASIINFLEQAANMGELVYENISTKGGWTRIYRPSDDIPDENAFRRYMARTIIGIVERELNP